MFNGFVWDDEVVFQKATPTPDTVYFRPAISAVYSTIYNIFGPQPFFFHFFQLILHITVAVLIYYLFRRFFKETVALILAVIFLVHPANVEAVSFASAMQEVGFTLVGIIELYIFTILNSSVILVKAGIQTLLDPLSSSLSDISLRVDDLRGDDTYIKVLFSTFILLIALLMKETAIVFFVLVFGYLLIFKKKPNNILVSYSISAVILLMIYLLVRISNGSLYVQGQGLFPIMRVPLATRLINIPSIIQYYLKMFFFPINLAIAQHWVIKSPSFSNFLLPLILEALLFLSAIIYSIKKKNKVFTLFFLWFLIGLLPHLQIVPLNMTVAERWLYFPMIGLLGMVGVVLSKGNFSLDSRLRGNDKIIIIMGIIIISLFSIRSFIRTLDWRNGLTLFGHDIRKDSSFDLQNNFGVELFRVGRYDEAKQYFDISTRLAPYWWVNWNNLGAIYEHEKNYQKAAEYYQKAIDNGQYYLAYENLAKILVFHGNDQKKAGEFLKKSLELFPKDDILQQLQIYYQQKN